MVIVDDVITAGTSVGESVDIIRAAGAKPVAVLIALDREEIVSEDDRRSAVQTVTHRYGLPVHAIAGLATLIEFLRADGTDPDSLRRVERYRATYGCSESAS